MRRLPTKLDGPVLVELDLHGDDRGFFAETYRRNVYAELGVPDEFVQDNHSRSRQGDRARDALPAGHGQVGALRTRRNLRRRRRHPARIG